MNQQQTPHWQNWQRSGVVARQIGISQSFVVRLIRAGKLRAQETVLGYLIDPESVEAYIRERQARKQSMSDDDGDASASRSSRLARIARAS